LTKVVPFASSVTRRAWWCGWGIESFEEAVEVVAGELPFERLGDLLVVSSEAEE
jgi:hypothetical protein